MQEETNQDNQKTIVSFIVGLLIGGLLVWAFSGPTQQTESDDMDRDTESEMTMDEADDTADNEDGNEPARALAVGSGEIAIPNQPASASIMIDSAEYPVAEGWIGVREYTDGELGYILGVNRFSQSQGLIPQEIVLQRPTIAGNEYAIVVYEEDGDFDFSLAGDAQLETIFDTFTAE